MNSWKKLFEMIKNISLQTLDATSNYTLALKVLQLLVQLNSEQPNTEEDHNLIRTINFARRFNR